MAVERQPDNRGVELGDTTAQRAGDHAADEAGQAAGHALVELGAVRVVSVIAGQESGQPFDGVLEFRLCVDERAKPSGQPLDSELLAPSPILKLLNPPVSEIHPTAPPCLGAGPRSGDRL